MEERKEIGRPEIYERPCIIDERNVKFATQKSRLKCCSAPDIYLAGMFKKTTFSKLSAPTDVNIEVTKACNCNCLHCYIEGGKTHPNELRTEEILKILKTLSDMNVFSVHFTGGEPLIRKDIKELVKEAHKLGFAVSLTTNGALLTEEIINFLKKYEVKLEISLDSVKPEVHDYLRQRKGLCEKVKESIKLVKRAGMYLTISPVISRLNFNDLEDICEFAVSAKVDAIYISDVIPIGRAMRNWNIFSLTIEEKRDLRRKVDNLKEKYPELDITANFWFEFFFDENKSKSECNGGVTSFTIRYDGMVKPCPYFPPDEEDSVRRASIESIWKNSKLFNKFRDGWEIKECIDCGYYMRNCEGGCRAVGYTYSGNFMGADYRCPKLN